MVLDMIELWENTALYGTILHYTALHCMEKIRREHHRQGNT